MKERIQRVLEAHNASFDEMTVDGLLSLFTEEMKKVIGEMEKLSPVGFNTERETYRNALRTEQLKRVREVRK